jgi:hypothetical protein
LGDDLALITLAKQSEPLNFAWSRPLPYDAKIVRQETGFIKLR